MSISFIIIFIICGLTVGLFVYAWCNDFNYRLFEFLLPIVASFLLASWLMFQITVLNRKEDPSPTKGAVTILFNPKTKKIKAGVPDFKKRTQSNLNKQGLQVIEDLQNNENIKTALNLNPDLSANNDSMLNVLEYSVFDWLKRLNDINDSWLNEEFVYQAFSHRSEQAISKLEKPGMTTVLSLGQDQKNSNPLLSIRPLEIRLPIGAKITQKALPGTHFGHNGRIIVIDTNHSTVEIWITTLGSRLANRESVPEINSYYSENDDVHLYYFAVELKQKIKWQRYFSTLRDFNEEWFRVLKVKFAEVFFTAT